MVKKFNIRNADEGDLEELLAIERSVGSLTFAQIVRKF